MVGTSSNRTLVRARYKGFVPASDGYGGNVELQILANESASPGEDFLRPNAGDLLLAFVAEAPDLAPDVEVTAQLGLVGGPHGGRAMLKEMTPVR